MEVVGQQLAAPDGVGVVDQQLAALAAPCDVGVEGQLRAAQVDLQEGRAEDNKIFILKLIKINFLFKGAYWIIQRFLVHYQILHSSNIAIAILDFSLLLFIKLSLFQLLRQQ